MILIDTDHVTLLKYPESERGRRFLDRLSAVPPSEVIGVAIVAGQFDDLRSQRLRLGTMDRKIAAIALVNNALLLSANRHDFERVPGLRVENWLD
jgi:tRNA(fMet)-specific endonuclease VapC